MNKLTVTCPPDFIEFRNDSINQGIHQRFEEQVRLHPNRAAIKSRDLSLTYREANGFSNSLAEEILLARGTELEQAIILLPNTADMIISLIASLKAHKAYVPLDPHFPKERLQAMVENARATVLLTDDQHLALAEKLCGAEIPIINISRIKRDPDALNANAPCDPLDRAYILYTSGSTGQPKGITFLHRNLLHTTMCLTNNLFFSPSDRVTWLHSASFAASVVDIYCALANGATLYPWDFKTRGFNGLADWLVQEKVTTFQWIPSAFRQFLRTVPDDFVFQDIRIAVMASEPLTVREVDLFRQHFPIGSHLVNQLGTSESYNYCLYPVDHSLAIKGANVPGGYSVSPDRQVVILDENRSALPPGQLGEIGVKSDYMSAGYWRDEALTRSKFIQVGEGNAPVLLTGDFGKLEPDGCLIHLGRKDSQVKIRGFRVELAEIDNMLASAPGVADSITWVVKNRLGEDRLVGYVMLQSGSFRQDAVEQHLVSRLPDYMLPQHYVVLESFPMLPTGKVDRRALPNPFVMPGAGEPAVTVSPPATFERELINIFNELLQSDNLGANSDFLKSGGDSLLTAVLTARIHQRFKVDIMSDQFAGSLTPAHLATLIRTALDGGRDHPSSRGLPSAAAVAALAEQLPSSRAETVIFKRPIEMAAKDQPSTPSVPGVRNLIIIGAGQSGREILAWANQAIAAGFPCRIKGFLDDRANALDGYDYPVKVLGSVKDHQIEKNDVFIGAIGDPKTKVKGYSRIIERGGQFVNLIHPLANIGNNVQLGTGIVMGPFSSVTCDVKIGSHVAIGAFSNVGHDTMVGDWCQISSHCGINGFAKLGPGVFLGSHACVIPGIQVGAWAFVGAGSVVVRDVPAAVKVFGNPAANFSIGAGVTLGPRAVAVKSVPAGATCIGVPALPDPTGPGPTSDSTAVAVALQQNTHRNFAGSRFVTILISSAGRRVELIRCFQADAKALGLNLRVLATDVEPKMSSACQAADKCFEVPLATSKQFTARLLQICREERVNLVVPTIDTELDVFTAERQRFESIGTRLLVSSPAVVRMARDKAATAAFLRRNRIPAPMTARLSELLKQPEKWLWPIILKPAHGSASVGICVVQNVEEAKLAAAKNKHYVAQELLRGPEYTVNLFFDQAGNLRSTVPHQRYEVRAGEVSKGIVRREPRLVDLAWRLGSVLKGAVGSLCFQAITPEGGEPVVFEINARFGGGYPLAHQAGATFTKWLLEEAAGMPSSADDHWEDGLTMLRYDAAIFRRATANT